jgi:hypothetical protein
VKDKNKKDPLPTGRQGFVEGPPPTGSPQVIRYTQLAGVKDKNKKDSLPTGRQRFVEGSPPTGSPQVIRYTQLAVIASSIACFTHIFPLDQKLPYII